MKDLHNGHCGTSPKAEVKECNVTLSTIKIEDWKILRCCFVILASISIDDLLKLRQPKVVVKKLEIPKGKRNSPPRRSNRGQEC